MDFGIVLNCPYCGLKQTHTIEKHREGKEIVVCEGEYDFDEPPTGCGKHFALFWEITTRHTVHAIEGDDTKKQAALGGDQ
ncbi:MAG: hypothetical protein FWB96_01465 [Defluviitaleaceae bacterium]|nr:hypothetical protein [Defluviitaleaceae bacterium]MCL2261638.1 hypothetical protein [Defluviitaleaceae bacterium]